MDDEWVKIRPPGKNRRFLSMLPLASVPFRDVAMGQKTPYAFGRLVAALLHCAFFPWCAYVGELPHDVLVEVASIDIRGGSVYITSTPPSEHLTQKCPEHVQRTPSNMVTRIPT